MPFTGAALDEAGDDDDARALAFEEVRHLGVSLGRQHYVAAIALDQRPPAEVADRKADVVAHHGREKPEQRHEPDAQTPGAGVNRTEDQRGFARTGTPKSSSRTSPATARYP